MGRDDRTHRHAYNEIKTREKGVTPVKKLILLLLVIVIAAVVVKQLSSE